MQITDLDYHNNGLIVQVEDTKTAEISAKDFFSFMSTWKGLMYDCDNVIIAIPHNANYISSKTYPLTTGLSITVYSFDEFRKRFATEMSEYVLEYINSVDIVFEDEDEDDFRPVSSFIFNNRIGRYDDPQTEAYQDFRRAQML